MLRGVPFGAGVVVLESVDSTNDELRRRADRGAAIPQALLAERQTAGRGRRGRAWHSPERAGLYVSVCIRSARPAREAPRFTIAAAVAACEACREAGAGAVEIKWPNDLVSHGSKLGGILTEARSVGEGALELIVGTGLNVMPTAAGFPAELRGVATTLQGVAGGAIDRERLAAGYLQRLGSRFDELERGAWQPLVDAWLRLAPGWRDRPVRIDEGGGPVEGIARGLDDIGALIVERPDGTRRTVHQADAVTPCEG